MSIDADHFWDENDEGPKRPGVSEADIAAWEGRHRVFLPPVLRAVLGKQNGGMVRYEPVRVLPLEEMIPPDDSFWTWAVIDKRKVKNRKLVITFAWGDDEPQYLMNFNANGRDGEPTVYSWFHDPGDMSKVASSLEEFFGGLLAASPTPAVDWSETERLDVVLFHERLDFGDDGDEYVLGRQGGALVLFTRDRAGKVISKTSIPEPLTTSLEEYRPAPLITYALTLEPEDGSSGVTVESTQRDDGLWKNRTERDAAAYVLLESRKQGTLQALRETLMGKAGVKKEDRDNWWWTWVWAPLIVLAVLPCILLAFIPIVCLFPVWWLFRMFRGKPRDEMTSPP